MEINRGEMTRLLRSWTGALFRSLSDTLASVLSSAEIPCFDDGDEQPKLFFTPAVASSSDYSFYSWQPGGQTKKLSCNGSGALPLPEGVQVSPITQPLHGLVLLRCWAPPAAPAGYFVCNPFTGAVLPLPDSRSPLRMMAQRHDDFGSTRDIDVRYGLDYSETTQEYKVVRVFSHHDRRDVFQTTICEVLVLDASTQWRPAVGGRPPQRSFHHRSSDGSAAVYFNGALHFLCDDDDDGSAIPTFDVRDETFGELLLPGKLASGIARLTVMDGHLCFHHGSPVFTSGEPYCVWTLPDYEAGNWQLICRVDVWALPSPLRSHHNHLFAPLYMRNRKILFGASYDCKVFVAEAAGRRISQPSEVSFSPPHELQQGNTYLRVGLLQESAVPVGRTTEELVFSSSPSARAWAEILKRLPAPEVGRLNLVSRDLRAVIQTDRFVRLHADAADWKTRRTRIMFLHQGYSAGLHFVPLKTLLGMPSKLPHVTDERCTKAFFCPKPCHGLNLVTCCRSDDFLCNPVTASCERVHQPGNEYGHVGLAYHPVVRKHMVVRLAHEDNQLVCKVRYINDYSWNNTAASPPRQEVTDAPPVFANDKLYWMVDYSKQEELGRSSTTSCEIMAFDVRTASFEVLQGPAILVDEGERLFITELKGTLCVAHSKRNANAIQVWAMKNNAVVWSLEYDIRLKSFSLSEETTPLAVDPEDGRILLNTGRALGYYDTTTATMETIYRMGRTPVEGNYSSTGGYGSAINSNVFRI
ncbi:hypothetical protein QOZ80_2BG0183770 [Eleusine coracana subsp. coracana]|nr:hypothetical protein QOZ80_2BG0183770 [Eleusine coracana subsp. coracana]